MLDKLAVFFQLQRAETEEARIAKTIQFVNLGIMLGLLAPIIHHIITGDKFIPLLILLSEEVVLVTIHFLIFKGHTRVGIWGLLVSILLLASLLIATAGDGYRDIGITIFPAVIVIAGLLLDLKPFFVYSSITLLIFAINMLVNLHGIIITRLSQFNSWADLWDGAIILVLTSFSVGLIVASLKFNYKKSVEASSKLKASNETLSYFIDGSPLSVVATDMDGKITLWNSAAERIFGWSANELIGNVINFVPPDRITENVNLMDTLVRTGNPFSLETIRLNNEGQRVDVNITATLTRNTDGSPMNIISIIDVITDRKRSERALRESEERYRKLVNNIPGAVFRSRADKNRTMMYMSDNIKEITGYVASDFNDNSVQSYCSIVLPEDSHIACMENFQPGSSHLKYNLEYRIRSKSGDIRWINERGKIDTDGNGNAVFLDGVLIDITDRKNFETALIESEMSYRGLFDSVAEAIYIHDTDGTFLDVNEGAVNMYGYPKEFFIGKTPDAISAEGKNDFDEVNKSIIKALNGEPQHIVFWGKRCNGEIFPKEVRLNKGLYFGKNVLIAMANDITSRRLAEEGMRKSEEKYRTLTDHLPVGIYRSSVEGTILYANPALVNLLGYDNAEELLRIPVASIFSNPADRQLQLKKVIDNEFEFSSEIKFLTKSGYEIWVHDHTRAITDDSGNIIYFDGIIENITERKLAEEALKQSEERFRNLAENIPGTIYLCFNDKKFTMLYLNDEIENLTGYRKEEFLDQNISYSELCHPDDRPMIYQDINTALAERKSFHLTYRIKRRDNTWRWIDEIGVGVFKEDQLQYLEGFLSDITIRKHAEEELLTVSKLKSIGILAGGIAHNFKNILAAMTLNVELAKLKPAKVNEYLEKVEKSINQASALATRFQTFSKGGEPIKDVVKIGPVIDEAESIALSGSDVITRKSIPEDSWMVEMDAKQMNEVFMNLLLNAKEAMPGGGMITINVANTVITQFDKTNFTPGRYLKISIIDEGTGISPKNLSNIFDPFFTTKSDGHGLGLSTVHFIIQKHRGYIKVESIIDKGTIFEIYLPASDKCITESTQTQNAFYSEVANKLLFMDDDDDIRENMCELGQLLNYEIIGARDGEEALRLYRKHKEGTNSFSAVILDLTIKGGMGGEETIAELLKIDPDVKAIVFSGHSTKPIVANYRDYGFKARLDKPADLKTLSKVIREVLELN